MFTALTTHPVLSAVGPWADGHGPGFPFFLFPFFALVTLVVLALVFGVLRRGSWRARSDARAVLADRFARGDIDHEEYRSRLAELSRT